MTCLEGLKVAPFAGAWIEMVLLWCDAGAAGVAPIAGAWIEIMVQEAREIMSKSRSLRGSVD